jgi:serine phosphatase RsbU (regulator of sigma subunit)
MCRVGRVPFGSPFSRRIVRGAARHGQGIGQRASRKTAGTLDTDAAAAGRNRTPLVLVLLLSILTVLLIAGGLYVRSVVSTAFRDAERIRDARAHVNDMLRHQLDEETGVRGYAASRLPVLLQAYYGGRSNLPLDFQRVRLELEALKADEALRVLRDAEVTNYRWVHEVAFPLIQSPGSHAAIELLGKTLVDRFRVDASTIYANLTRRTGLVNARTRRALVSVGAFAVAAIAVVVSASLLFLIQQNRLSLRLEQQRAEAERERRMSVDVRSAYETEKRLADTLQEALSQRDFPELPTVSFSATYIPATQESRVGGDWYDALLLSEGKVLVAIGDVTGHGIDAVVAMNRARQLLTRSALLDADPAAVLRRANAELVSFGSPIITAISGVVNTHTFEFAYAVAGHPPPVLFEPGRGARLLKFGSLPLGVATTSNYQTNVVRTVAGAMIVLYTDGMIEYSRDIAAGEAALLAAVESAATRPRGQAADAIRASIFRSQEIADDVALMTIRLWDAPQSGSVKTPAESRRFYRLSRSGEVPKLDMKALRRSA